MKRSIQLDVLRGCAIMLVLGGHLELARPHGWAAAAAGVWHEAGGFGVPLFFTLSGYLVGGLLLAEMRRHGSIGVGRFLARRALKIYPGYFVLLAYLVVTPALKAGPGDTLAVLSRHLRDYLPNLLFVQNYVGANPAGYTWSMAVEEHFYVTLPLLLLVALRLKRTAWLAPLCLLAPAFGTGVRVFCAWLGDPYFYDVAHTMAATHLCLDGLFVGVGVRALAEFSPARFAWLCGWRRPLLGGILLLAATSAIGERTAFGVEVNRILPLSAVAATGILVAVLAMRASDFRIGRSAVVFAARALAWIGRYSYGIYLWHITVMGFAIRVLVPRLPGFGGESWRWAASAALVLAVIVLFGAAMSRLVEAPVLALRDWFVPSPASVPPGPAGLKGFTHHESHGFWHGLRRLRHGSLAGGARS